MNRSASTCLFAVLVLGASFVACDDGGAPPASDQALVGAAGSATTSAGGQKSNGSAGTQTTGVAGASSSGGTLPPPSPMGGSAGATNEPPPPIGSAGSPANGGSAGGPDVSPPTPECAKGGFYDFSAKALDDIQTIPMCSYAGKVVLVVNVASKCGYTPQYKPLQALYAKYQEQGLVVLGFPSADFGNQEFADDKDISAFCTTTYGITFPMFSRIDVKGPNQDPLYTWLTKQPGGEGEITWNFNKFLLGRDGVFRQRFATEISPDAAVLTQAVEAALAAP